MWDPGGRRLSLDERVEIRLGLERGLSFRAIARSIERDSATISREVKANGGRDDYRPLADHRRAEDKARRHKDTKLAANPALCARVVADLEQLWSPEQIAARLKDESGDDPTMQISHETIYKASTSRGGASCGGSWQLVCAPGEPGASHAAGSRGKAASPTR
jgi:IS30 family transposase